MRNSKLVEIYLKLDKKELRLLAKFVRSPFFNHREDVIRLNDYLKKKIPEILKKEQLSNKKHDRRRPIVDKTEAFTYVYPKTPYDEKQFGYITSFQYQLIRRFLSYQEFVETPHKEQIYLTRALRRKRLPKTFAQELQRTLTEIENRPERNADYHLNRYLLQYEKCQLIATQQRIITEDHEKLSEELNAYFIASILKLSCMLLNMKAMYSKQYSLILLKDVIRLVEENDYSDDASIAVYYNIYKVLTEPDSKIYFDELRKHLTQFQACFPHPELLDIYLLAINYCIKRINEGERQYFREVFEIYKEGLANRAFMENDVLSKFTYSNIVRTGCGLEEHDWVEQFIYEYKEYLPPLDREKVYMHNLAYLFFKKPDYPKAMDLLQNVSFNDLYYDLDARRMLLVMYYDLGNFDALNSLLDSFKNFIYRHKELGYHRDNYLKLIKYTRQLLQLRSFDKEAISLMKSEVENTESLADKKWLLTQLEKV